MMRITDRIALRREGMARGRPQGRLIRDGRATGKVVNGAVLEAAVETGDGTLLFLTEDVPHEEGLAILFLDRALALRDSATILMPYATGTFSDLRLLGEASLGFRFLAERPWRLTHFDRARPALPLTAGSMGIWRPFTFTRRFGILPMA